MNNLIAPIVCLVFIGLVLLHFRMAMLPMTRHSSRRPLASLTRTSTPTSLTERN